MSPSEMKACGTCLQTMGIFEGLFASVYSPITDAAVDAIDAGEFVHDLWVRELVIDFAARYYDNLRASMLAQSTTQSWGRYYGLSDDCDVAGLRIAVFGIAVHLIVDLPHTLATISSTDIHKDDYDQFGHSIDRSQPSSHSESSGRLRHRVRKKFSQWILSGRLD